MQSVTWTPHAIGVTGKTTSRRENGGDKPEERRANAHPPPAMGGGILGNTNRDVKLADKPGSVGRWRRTSAAWQPFL